MDVILSTGCLYHYPLPEILQIAKTTGFDGIELLISQNTCNIAIDRIRELSDSYGVPILSIHSPFVTCDGWGGFWNRIQRSLVIAMELSIPLVNFHPPTGLIPRHRLGYDLLAHIALYKGVLKKSNIVLTIENLPTKRSIGMLFINRYFPLVVNNMYQIAEFAASNGIHVTFDTTHVGTTGVNLLEAYHVFEDRIENIHLSDHDGRHQHLLPGTGNLPLKELIAQAISDGYNGLITLETCPTAMEYEDKAKAAQNAEMGLRYIRDALQSNGV